MVDGFFPVTKKKKIDGSLRIMKPPPTCFAGLFYFSSLQTVLSYVGQKISLNRAPLTICQKKNLKINFPLNHTTNLTSTKVTTKILQCKKKGFNMVRPPHIILGQLTELQNNN